LPGKNAVARLLLVALVLALGLLTAVWAVGASAEESPSADEIEALIDSLEDEQARAELVRKLRILADVQEPKPVPDIQTATGDLMQSISDGLAVFGTGLTQIARSLEQLPHAYEWLGRAATDPGERALWINILMWLAVVLGSAYLAAGVMTRLLAPARTRIAATARNGWTQRLIGAIFLLLLDLLPIAAFAAAGYAVLAVAAPPEQTRLVALVWLNASIIVRVVMTLSSRLFAEREPALRLIPSSDETAHYIMIWLRRMVSTAIYGFFGLQAALLLGLGSTTYTTLLHLLGLVLTLMALILIMQNRHTVAQRIRGRDMEGESQGRAALTLFRRRLAQSWHLLAGAYLILLFSVWALDWRLGFLFVLRATLLTVAAVIVARLALHLVDRLFARWLSINAELRHTHPQLEARVNHYFPLLQGATRWLIYIIAGLAILHAWGIDALAWLVSEPGLILGGAAARILGVLIMAVIVWEIAASFIERYLAESNGPGGPKVRSARAKTLLTVARNALLVVLVVMSSLIILSELGINIAPLLAGAGVLGLAIGFGAQRLVQDVITGVFILMQDLMAVGDVVKLGDRAGLVEAISIRTVRLRDLSGTVHTIPFSAIDTVSNLTRDFSFYVFDLGVAYREDVDEVMEVIRQVGEELRSDPEIGPVVLEPLEIFGVDAFGDSAVVIKGRIKTQPIKQWMVGRAFNRRIKKRFDELGIEIPFPHQTIYFGVDKDGTAPPLQVSPGIAVHGAPTDVLFPQRKPDPDPKSA
jgi:moderate conductance mechanosensitive channel